MSQPPYIPSFDTVMRSAHRHYLRRERQRRTKRRILTILTILLVLAAATTAWFMLSTREHTPMVRAQLVAQCQTAHTDTMDAYNNAVRARNGFLHRFEQGQVPDGPDTGDLLGLEPAKPTAMDCNTDPQHALDAYQRQTTQLNTVAQRFTNM